MDDLPVVGGEGDGHEGGGDDGADGCEAQSHCTAIERELLETSKSNIELEILNLN